MKTLVQYKILVIDDELATKVFFQTHYKSDNYILSVSSSGQQAIELYLDYDPDIIVVNFLLPDMDGILLCRRFRAMELSKLPLIFILANPAESFMEVQALKAGADDFIIKPLQAEPFKSRLEAFLRRMEYGIKALGEPYLIKVDDLRIDINNFVIYNGTQKNHLSKKEAEFLTFLVTHPNQVLTRNQLLEEVWGDNKPADDISVDSFVFKIRQKIGEHRIQTIKHVGYKFVTS